ncbi:hypothetical protein [Shewanella holmiensis]|uniref:Molecular chaperone DnaJ n=1 Tax=Shewanella holmiensis TaxID=2952222 RepID=A0A9X2WM69_9GAMM|nr:hypothetical protein [Shewanella holmiensis]MCT7941729.1 hypothetical protein [Shewanella holmiensis]
MMGFVSRKSFTEWQREELNIWIESNIDSLYEHPFSPEGLSQALRKEYTDSLLDTVNVMDKDGTVDPLHILEMRNLLAELDIEDNFSDEQLAEFIREPRQFHDYIETLLASRENEAEADAEAEFDEGLFEDIEDDFINSDYFQHFQQSHKKHQKKLKDLFDASLLRKCYKKLANILHPDKEPNAALKLHKSELMAMLVQAKKEKDAFTIISLYQEHVPDNDLNLDEDVSNELLALIDEKLRRLDDEYHHLKYEPNIENMVWRKLGGRSKKIMDEKKQTHLSELQQACDEIALMIKQCKNMKQLNKQLSDRYERRQPPFTKMADFNEFMSEIDFDDFFKHFPFK